MPKQHQPNNELTNGGQKQPSSNNGAAQHNPSRTDDVILLTPINQKQPTVAKPKPPTVSKPKQPTVTKPKQPAVAKPQQPAVSKTKQPTVAKPKQPAVKTVKKQNDNSNNSYKTPQKQPKLPPRIATNSFQQTNKRKRRKQHSLGRTVRKTTGFFISLIFGILMLAGIEWFNAVQKGGEADESISLNPLTSLIGSMKPKTASQRAFQREWEKIQQEEASGVVSTRDETTRKQKTETAVVEAKEKVVEKTAAVDSGEATAGQAVEPTLGKAIESSAEDSETEDDNDDLVMDFLKKRVGTVTGRPSSQGTRRIRRPPNPVLQQYVPRGSWSPGNLSSHWAKHGHEFPEYGSEEEYGKGALYFFEHPPPGTLRKTRGNGDRLYYYPRTNTFGVTTADGTPKTMFRPDSGMDYCNRQ
ncbi:MAG: hypothetical protein J6T06_12400 [Victivallales bacterium]|nr:hypothetical protein [Victivallales bacterium]